MRSLSLRLLAVSGALAALGGSLAACGCAEEPAKGPGEPSASAEAAA
ncbi:hypothetical protein [Spirillospora sp. NPDC029432]